MLPKVFFLLVTLILFLASPVQTIPDSSGLIITDFQVSTTKIQLGETFTLSGKVVNLGSYSAFHISPVTFFKNISVERGWWYPQEIPSESRSITELKPGEVWNFSLIMRGMSVATFDVGVYVIYTKSPEGGSGTEVRSRTVRIEVTRMPPLIPSWPNWWTAVALTVLVVALSWRLKWLWKLRKTWKTLVVVVFAMVAIGSIVYTAILDHRWMPALILGLPLIEVLLGFVSKKALASFLAPVIPSAAVSSVVEVLQLLPYYYSPGSFVIGSTAYALLMGLIGSGAALRRQGKAVGTILLTIGLAIWFFLWLHSLTSG